MKLSPLPSGGSMVSTIHGRYRWLRRTGRWLVFLVALAPLLVSSRGRTEAPAFLVASEPSWVLRIDPETARESGVAPGETTSNGRRLLLADHQVRLSGKEQETYWHWTSQITNESGLQAMSQVSVDVDATYQTLILHHVEVRRGAETLDRLDRKAVRIVQREPDLERQVLRGVKSTILFVRDLRVGDIVDYAYTLRGADPTLDGRYADSLLLGFPEPVNRLHVRIVAPPSRHMRIVHHGPEEHNEAFAARITTGADTTEYRWDLSSVPAYAIQAEAPRWYSFYPWAQISEFESWREVANWAARLFQSSPKNQERLRAWVQATQREAKSPDDFLLRAARFVQDEIRYVGIEVGMGRRLPTSPGEVLERRYGDCKDKTVLLVTLLRLAGLSGQAVLVNSSDDPSLPSWAPSPAAFDHAMVRATGSDGKTYFIDTTIALQGGGLAAFEHSSHVAALRLDDATIALEPLSPPPAEQQLAMIIDTFKVASPGSENPTTLDVERVFRGDAADAMRSVFRSASREQLGKQFLDVYQRQYPSVKETAPLEHSEDREANWFRVVEHYAIPQFWNWAEPQRQHTAEVAAHLMDVYLKRPAAPKPDVPIAVVFPRRVRHALCLILPFDLPIVPQHIDIKSPAFMFTFESANSAGTLSYTFDLLTLRPAALPADISEHVAAVDKARLALTRGIIFQPPWATGPNWTAIAVAAGVVPLLMLGAWRLRRYSPPPKPAAASPSDLVGLGGWLYLVGLGVVVAPVRNVVSMTSGMKTVFSLAPWQALTTPHSVSYRPALAAAIVVELVVQATLVIMGALLIELFFREKRFFPRLFCAVLIASAAFMLIDHVVVAIVLAASESTAAKQAEIARSIIIAGIWVAYFRFSKRVAATFVN